MDIPLVWFGLINPDNHPLSLLTIRYLLHALPIPWYPNLLECFPKKSSWILDAVSPHTCICTFARSASKCWNLSHDFLNISWDLCMPCSSLTQSLDFQPQPSSWDALVDESALNYWSPLKLDFQSLLKITWARKLWSCLDLCFASSCMVSMHCIIHPELG